MRRQFGIAIPGQGRAFRPAAAQPVEAGIADAERVDRDLRLVVAAQRLMRGPEQEERSGRTRVPSPVVPSANSTTACPSCSRRPISLATAAVALRRMRSMKTVRCSLASPPISGQVATSDLATKASGRIAPSTEMSSQETWLATISPPRPAAGGVPRMVVRTPRPRQTSRWNSRGKRAVARPEPQRRQLEREHRERAEADQREPNHGAGA